MNPAPLKRPCLLLVDDVPENIAILVEQLQEDYELKIATRGAQALKICEQTPQIDLILLDIMMPGMDGYEVCSRLRAAENTRATPIIFLTAKAEIEGVVRGFEIGANDYVLKPVRVQELLARVRTHLLIRAQQREIAEKNTELRELLQIMSHDLANHFAVLSLTLGLAEHVPDIMNKMMPQMQAAVRNGIALTALVRDLRRAEDKGLDLSPVLVSAAIDEALLLAEARLSEKRLKVHRRVAEIRVLAEATALTNSVLGNLLSNAIKFSHVGGAIEISAHVEDGAVAIRVCDHGIGMGSETLARLFDAGKSQSCRGTSGESGTGFGMPVMRKFVTMFGGTVEVVSRESAAHPDNPGTEFTVRLKPAPAESVLS